MAFEKIASLDSDISINLGGTNKKTGKPNPMTVEGYYLGTKVGIPNKFDASKPDCMHILQTPKGNVGVWGKSHLNPQMAKALPGAMVRITFTGTRPSKKGNDQLLFSVEQDTANNIDVSSINDAPADYGDDLEEGYTAEDATPAEAPYVAPTPPKVAAKAPDAARQAKVAALLNGSRNKTS